jgi:hypothetical protein
LGEEEEYDPDEIPVISSLRYGSLPPGHPAGDPELLAVRFRRTGSERLRDGAKALLRRMESLKSRRRRRQNREGVVISGPQVESYVHFEKLRNVLDAHQMVYSILSVIHAWAGSTDKLRNMDNPQL